MALFSIKCIPYLINVPQSWSFINAYEALSGAMNLYKNAILVVII